MDTESKVAIGLFVGGMCVLGFDAISAFGITKGALYTFMLLTLIALQVGLGLVACLMISRIMGSSFGMLGHAIIKLAGIITAVSALGVLLPSGTWIVLLVIYFALLYYLFELEWAEVIGFALALWLLRVAALMVFGNLLASMFAGA